MIQHPIPQNVTSYQFRLIGDMTIKQFIFLSIGVGAAVAFYYSNLFFFFKWFFILISAMTGFAVAFIPLEERPLDQWFTNYFRAIYRPTYFIWKKDHPVPEYFTFNPNISLESATDAAEISRIAAIRRQQGLSSYLTTLPQDSNTDLDTRERAATQNFTSLFQLANPTLPSTPPPSVAPQLPRHRPLSQAHLSIPVPQAAPARVIVPPAEKVISSAPTPVPASPQTTSTTLAPAKTARISPATTSSSLPFPSAPTVPNIVVGMVIDAAGKIVPGAIVEVIDSSGLPARATKTNQLGQFFSTTPLKRGTYHLNVDKDGLTFDTIELQLTGQIVEPLKIQAR
jgi:hypothetical protein